MKFGLFNISSKKICGYLLQSFILFYFLAYCFLSMNRLTFWFSNILLLRAIVSKEVENIHFGDGSCINSEWDAVGNTLHKEENDNIEKQFHSWENPKTFLIALEKVEAWIFSRIVESVWWQVESKPFIFSFYFFLFCFLSPLLTLILN